MKVAASAVPEMLHATRSGCRNRRVRATLAAAESPYMAPIQLAVAGADSRNSWARAKGKLSAATAKIVTGIDIVKAGSNRESGRGNLERAATTPLADTPAPPERYRVH